MLWLPTSSEPIDFPKRRNSFGWNAPPTFKILATLRKKASMSGYVHEVSTLTTASAQPEPSGTCSASPWMNAASSSGIEARQNAIDL